MTKQTKIGLFVGMACVLLIAILVSDYLSRAGQQTGPGLTDLAGGSANPLDSRIADGNHDLMAVSPRTNRPVPQPGEIPPGSNPHLNWTDPSGRSPGVSDDSRDPVGPLLGTRHRQGVYPMPSQPPNPVAAVSPRPRFSDRSDEDRTDVPRVTANRSENPTRSAAQIHHVGENENLSTIARHYYGKASLWRKVYQANRNVIRDPNFVRTGVRLVIPLPDSEPSATAGRVSADRTRTATSGGTRARRIAESSRLDSYTIRSGDTLSHLAQRFYGTQRAMTKLHELNKDRISDPNVLQIGMTIRVPKR